MFIYLCTYLPFSNIHYGKAPLIDTIFANTSDTSAPLNNTSPVYNSAKTQPNDQRSILKSYLQPNITSGAL